MKLLILFLFCSAIWCESLTTMMSLGKRTHTLVITNDGHYVTLGEGKTRSQNDYDILAIDFNFDLEKVWENKYGNAIEEVGDSIIQTSDKGFLISGKKDYHDKKAPMLVKTYRNGTLNWIAEYPKREYIGKIVAQEQKDNYYIVAGLLRNGSINIIQIDAEQKYIVNSHMYSSLLVESLVGIAVFDIGYALLVKDTEGYSVIICNDRKISTQKFLGKYDFLVSFANNEAVFGVIKPMLGQSILILKAMNFINDVTEESKNIVLTNIRKVEHIFQITPTKFGIIGWPLERTIALIVVFWDGSIHFKRHFTEREHPFIRFIGEGMNGDIIMLKEYSQSVILWKYTPPIYGSPISCTDDEKCNYCEKNTYWNYTKCDSCSPYCSQCINNTHCLVCSNSYVLTPENTCKKGQESICNCSEGIIFPECQSICNIIKCPIVSIYKHKENANKSICKCQESLFDNGTHCIKPSQSNCHPLCSYCIKFGNESLCTKCKSFKRIQEIKNGSYFVSCKCNEEEGTAGLGCGLKTSKEMEKGGFSFSPLLVGALAVVVAIAIIIVILIKKQEKWKRMRELPKIVPEIKMKDIGSTEMNISDFGH